MHVEKNVISGKCTFREMYIWDNRVLAKCFSGSVISGRCFSGRCIESLLMKSEEGYLLQPYVNS